MPRDSFGNYILPSGNPVEAGEVVSSVWANSTLSDVATAMTDSLDRFGRGGMLAPFRFADGTNLLPGATWANEATTGFYRFDLGDLRVAVLSQDVMRWKTTGTEVWEQSTQTWATVGQIGGRNGLTVLPMPASTTAIAGRLYNMTAGGLTLTLPPTPSVGDVVGVFNGNFNTSVVDPNGLPVNGIVQNVDLDLIDCCLVFQYVSVALGWTLISQALNSAVTGGLPTGGQNDGDPLVWDDTTDRWTNTNLYNFGRDGVFSGVLSGDVPNQNLTHIQVVAALPGTPNGNVLYLIPGGGIYLGATLIAGTGWEAGGAPDSIVNSNSGNIFMVTLPTLDPSVTGALWNNAGVVNISV